jgi:hypothetical protein
VRDVAAELSRLPPRRDRLNARRDDPEAQVVPQVDCRAGDDSVVVAAIHQQDNDLSILSTSIGSRLRWPGEELPLPKSSIASRTLGR